MQKNRVLIFDTTLRDGEQIPGASLNTLEKLEIAKQLERLGVDIIEAGFPISSPGDFQSVSVVAKECKNVIVCGLTRALEKDIEVAAAALKPAQRPRIHTGIGASDIHIKYKFKSTRDTVLEQGVAAVRYARKLVGDVEFYAEDAGRADLEFLAHMVEEVIKAGASTVNIPDTTGYNFPEEFGQKISYLFNHVPNIDKAIISVHCHNDLGLATANTLSAILHGARQVEVTMNGLGERAGNTSLEEVVMALKTREKHTQLFTGIKTTEIYKTSRLVSQLTGIVVQPNKAIVGRNAFAHSSGIHQDGVLKQRETYEIINPQEVGVHTEIVLTARSGRHALVHRLEQLGYKQYSKEQIEELYVGFKNLADSKKEVYDEDLRLLVQGRKQQTKGFFLKSIQVCCGTDVIPRADVVLVDPRNKQIKASAKGTGPVDAAYQAVNAIVKKKVKLLEFLLKAVTAGIDAQADVQVLIEAGSKTYLGSGIDTDIVIAATKAYLDALNKIK